MQPILAAQTDAMQQRLAQGEEAWNYRSDLMADAAAFDTDAKRRELAEQAAADVGRAFTQQKAMRERADASRGVNPNSGAARGLARADDLALAATRADAMNDTRTQAEQLGWARRMGAAGLADPSSAYATSVDAGNSASRNMMAPGVQYQNAMQGAANTLMSGQQMRIGGLSSVMNTQANVYNNYEDPLMMGLGLAAQGIATYAGAGGTFSDRRVKKDIARVGEYPNGLPMYEFTYRGDQTGTRYRGVIAQDVEQVFPEAVEEFDGIKRVNYALLGIEMEEVQ
jgi:hypothetical protein